MGKGTGRARDILVDVGIVVLAVHNEMIHQRKQLRQADMAAIGFDTGMDILLLQHFQKRFQGIELHGYLAAGEGDTAAVKEHHTAGANLLYRFPDIQGFSAGDIQSFRIGAPGTPKVAALQMVYQPVAGAVLGIVEAFLKNADLHCATSFAAIIPIIVKFVNFVDKPNGGFYNS
jgi:hypothetical protein